MSVVRKTAAIFSKENFTINILGACSSGVFVGAVMEDVVDSGYFQTETFIKFAVLSACSYVLVTLFLHRSTAAPNHTAPRWVVIAIVGSIMSSVTGLLGAQWQHVSAYIVDPNVRDLWAALGEHIIPVVFILTVNTLIACILSFPIMLLFHLFGVVVNRAHARRV
jgi:hypothetical protein